jgi:glucosamine kinase
MAEPLFIGVDGGATKCLARLRDSSGRLLGEGSGGPANARAGHAAFTEVMKACTAAARAAGLGTGDLARVHAGFGLAGTAQKPDRDFILAQENPFASLVVDTDAYAAYMGAFDGRDGAILIVGTGAAGLAVVKGERINVGGWGHQIGDEGSGMMIGRTAVRRALWAHEGMAPMTPLATAVLDRFDHDPTVAVTWADRAAPKDFGEFAPLVFDHAERRDALAMPIIEEAAHDVTRLIGRLLEVGAPQVAMIGSVFPRLLPWLPPPIARACVKPERDAADGAIRMAEHALTARGGR